MSKKRILLVSDVKGWGGWTRGEYIKKYLSDEFIIDLVDANGFERIAGGIDKEGFTINDVKEFQKTLVDKDFLNFKDFQEFFLSRKKNIKYDLYYLLFHTMLNKKSVKRLLRKGEKIATIVTGFPTLKNCFGNNREEAYKNFLPLVRNCKGIFANSILGFNDLKSIIGKRGIKAYYCPRGVDENVFYPTDNGFNTNKKFTAAYVGKPVPEKGLNEIIKPACDKLGINLIINDRNWTNALGQDDMRNFYNKADVYIVASTIDGTPNPALEAAACGKPIISNKIGNMPEFINHDKNGFLLKERKVDFYVRFLQKMIDNRKKCYEMGREARQTILKSWTWEKVLENERNAFRGVLR